MTCADDIPAGRFIAPPFFNVNSALPPGGTPGSILVRSADGSPYAVQWAEWGGLVGENGWSPVLAVEADGDRSVLRLVDWVGGEGTKPTLLGYIGPTGIVPTAAAATNLRGLAGGPGDTGDPGEPGPPGPAGRGIQSVTVNAQQQLVVTYTDNTTQVVGTLNRDQRGVITGPTANTTLTNNAYTTLIYEGLAADFSGGAITTNTPTAGTHTVNEMGAYELCAAVTIVAGTSPVTQSVIALFATVAGVPVLLAAESDDTAIAAGNTRVLQLTAVRSLPSGSALSVRCYTASAAAGAVASTGGTLGGQSMNGVARFSIFKLERGIAGGQGAGEIIPVDLYHATATPAGTATPQNLSANHFTPLEWMVHRRDGRAQIGSGFDQMQVLQSTPTNSVNEVYVSRFLVTTQTTMSLASCYVVTPEAGTNVVCRLYEADVNNPTRPGLAVSPKLTFSGATSGVVVAATGAVSLSPSKIYYAVYTYTGGTGALQVRNVQGVAVTMHAGTSTVAALFQANAAARLDSADLSGQTWNFDVSSRSLSTRQPVGFNFSPA